MKGAFQARKAATKAQSGGEKDVPIRDRRALIQQVENRKRMAVNIPPFNLQEFCDLVRWGMGLA